MVSLVEVVVKVPLSVEVNVVDPDVIDVR